MLVLEHGKPMIFGKDRDKGIRLHGLHPEVVTIGEDGVTEDDLLVHDEHADDPYLALILSRMFWPEFPVPVGVLRDVEPADPLGPDGRPDPAGDREVGRGRPREGAARGRDLDRRVTLEPPMLCPVCRHDNFEGEDTCANCGADLSASDLPQPALEFHDTVLGERLASLGVGEPSVVAPGLSVSDAVRRMHDAATDCLLVSDGDRLVGIFTDRDAVVRVAGRTLGT